MEQEIAVGHSFDFTLHVEDIPFREKVNLCNLLDSYELERSVEDLLVVDVISFDAEHIVLRISLKKPLTYSEIDTYLEDLIVFAQERLQNQVKMSPLSINWNVGLYGVPSTKVDLSTLTDRASKMESLKSLQVEIVKEVEKSTESEWKKLDVAAGYIVKEKRPEKAFMIFEDLVTHGVPGLLISRTHPDKVREKHGLRNTPIIWLSRQDKEDVKIIQPTRLPQLGLLIQRFLNEAQESVLLLDGVEYLITHNSFATILKLLQNIMDDVMSSRARFLISLDPDALEPKNVALLERDFSSI